MLKIFLTTLLLSLCSNCVYSQIDDQLIPGDSTIRKGVLDNGLTYFVSSQKNPEGKVSINLVLRGACYAENDDELGLSHVLEHVLSRETKNFPYGSIQRFINRTNVANNATTSQYSNLYYFNDLPNTKQLVDSCLSYINDVTKNGVFRKETVETHKAIVINEQKYSGDPGCLEKRIKTQTEGSVYQDHFNSSNFDIVRHCTPKKLRNLYRRLYQPQNMALIVIGDIDADSMIADIRTRFGDLRCGKDVLPEYPLVPAFEGTKIQLCTKDYDKDPYIDVIMVLPDCMTVSTVGDERKSYMYKLLSAILRSKLYLENKNCQLVSNWNSFYCRTFGWLPRTANLTAHVDLKQECWKEPLVRIMKTLERMRRFGVESSKWQSAIKSKPLYNEDSTALVFGAADNVTNNNKVSQCIDEFIYGQRVIAFLNILKADEYSHSLMTSEELDREFRKVSDGNNRHVTLSFPLGMTLPKEEEVRMVIDSISHLSDEELKEEIVETPQLSTKTPDLDIDSLSISLAPGEIVSLAERQDGHTEMMLSNGVKVLLHKDEEAESVSVCFARPSGLSVLSDENYLYGGLLNGDCFINSKYGDATPLVEAQNYKDVINAKTSAENLGKCLKSICYNLAFAEVDSLAFSHMLNEYNAPGINKKEKYKRNRLNLSIYDNLSRFSPDSLQVQSLNMRRFKQVARDYRSNYNGSVVHIRGNVSTDSIKPYIRQYIASLPSKSDAMVWSAKHLAYVDRDTVVLDYFKGTEEKVQFKHYYVQDKNFEYTPENYANIQVLKNVLNYLLYQTIRERDRDVYWITSYSDCSFLPCSKWDLYISSICTEDKMERIRKNIDKLMHDVAYGDLVTQDLIDDFVTRAQLYLEEDSKGSIDCVDMELYGNQLFGENLTYIRKVTPESVRKLVRSLLENCRKVSINAVYRNDR